MDVVPEKRLALFAEMENRYEKKDVDYFVSLLTHEDYVVRTRADRKSTRLNSSH